MVCASSLLLAACHIEDDSIDPLHIATDSSYVDTDLGYSLAFPQGWWVGLEPIVSREDFQASTCQPGVDGKPQEYAMPTMFGSHSKSSGSSLRSFLEAAYDTLPAPYYDSVRVRASQTRSGVEVIPVDLWYSYSSVHYAVRELYFLRRNQRVRLHFSARSGFLESHAGLKFIDSSLTFF